MNPGKQDPKDPTARFPGVPTELDGSEAVVAMETAASEAAGAYPITPSTQMGEGWALAVAAGRPNVNGRNLIFFEPEGEHAAAAVTAGMSLVGLRSTNFSSGQGIAYMHESLYAAVGKRLTYVLNVACRAMTKQALNVHAGHDDYHAVDDTGFFQLFAKDVQSVADLNLVAHRIAELTLNPGICAQDGFLTSHVIETLRLPERELVKEYLGDPSDLIDCPTPAQRLVFGERRRRIPELFDVDNPAMLGVVQNQDSYAQGVAAQRPFYFDHVAALTDQALDEFAALTGRRYARASGYRLDDAEVVLVGQGSVVSNAEAVVDHLRESRGLKVGVLDLTMFRPFPADLVTAMLRGKRAAVVLERVDQPLAVDAPLLREIRAAMGQALENGRSNGTPAHPGLAPCRADEVPEFYSGCFGLGSRDLQPGDLVAAVENVLPGGAGRRQFYLGIEFVRKGTLMPKIQLWQEQMLEGYPHLADLALPMVEGVDLLPKGSTSIRIHSIGGWGAITMGKNLSVIASELLGLHVKANPKYGSEKKGQPTTFYASLSPEPLRLNCELKTVDVVLSPDPGPFAHAAPLAGLGHGGVFVLQSDQPGPETWAALPDTARREIREKDTALFHLDAFAIAADEASDPEMRFRMQGAAFLGAFFRASTLADEAGLDEERLFEGIRQRLVQKFGKLGDRVVEENLRVIRRGYDEVTRLELPAEGEVGEVGPGSVPVMPPSMAKGTPAEGIGSAGRFWEQVGSLYAVGEDVLADPFAALSAIPAATSAMRDMSGVRFEVPEFLADKCTGCSQCWVQCPDSAIPGVVNTVEEVLDAAIATAAGDSGLDRLRGAVKPLAKEARKILSGVPFHSFGDVISQAWENLIPKLAPDAERRSALDAEFAAVQPRLAEFPLAKTQRFFDIPEEREKGTGGLLSITVNPRTCKGCNVCVAVCPDGALVPVKQDDDLLEELETNWELWENLPDTDDRYIDVTDLEDGVGILSSLLLKKEAYEVMRGGDGACSGCGEKTGQHLIVAAISALMRPHVDARVKRLDELIAGLDARARALLVSDADLDDLGASGEAPAGHVDLPLDDDKRREVEREAAVLHELRDLRWRYAEGPTGTGRRTAGMINSTGCSSVWGSTYPFNPYPFPWVNHLFQDAPSMAIGIFEGHMRKMADGFRAVRRAEKMLAGTYDRDRDEPELAQLDWLSFTDEEFALCPPILAVGGDGAMLDIGFQNLSRLMASGKPLRVVVLDTQVYSNTGGQACTSGFEGQVSDMAAFGPSQHGKQETRKELSLIAMAHRGAFVLQSSQASPAHLLGGVLRGLKSRRPAVFQINCPCPPEHGIGDDASLRAAKLATESRAFPLMLFDPDAGDSLADCLELDGNPSVGEVWPTYELGYVDDDGAEQTMSLPLTIADWASSEARFRKHFRPLGDDAEEPTVFHEYYALSPEEREDCTPFVYALGDDRHLSRMRVSNEIVHLAEDRLALWHQLKHMAGLEVPDSVRDEVEGSLEEQFLAKEQALRAEYEGKLSDLRRSYPPLVARRLAEGLLKTGNGSRTVAELLNQAQGADLSVLDAPAPPPATDFAPSPSAAGTATATAPPPEAAPKPTAPAQSEEDDDALVIDPWIETVRCTTCNECTNLNGKLFAYDDKKQAYIKDPKAGTFRELVTAAERCPVFIIHPGTPLNPKEKNLEKWLKRAERFA
jgi:pyruvate-ferredoxin/flavodoxin oxidoreductase